MIYFTKLDREEEVTQNSWTRFTVRITLLKVGTIKIFWKLKVISWHSDIKCTEISISFQILDFYHVISEPFKLF